MREIALNFFPLATDQFKITLYRLPFAEGERPKAGDEEAVRRYLEIDGEGDYYWTFFQQPPRRGTKVVCEPFNNVYATIDALRLALIQSCENNLGSDCFRVVKGFRRYVEIITGKFSEGSQVISLEPYLLRSSSQFGFLADFRFHPTEEHRGTRRALQLSLSLDKHGQPNLNHYADRYSQLAAYVAKFHDKIFPLHMPDGQEVAVVSRFVELKPETLDVKNYVVGSSTESKSQFMGVKQSGPFEKIPEDVHLYFLYRKEDRPLSRDLFRALRGDTFSTFNGMERMFHFPISNKNVRGIILSDFSPNEIQRVRDQIIKNAPDKVVPIVLTPFSRHDTPEENVAYWNLKHAFLSKDLPIQVVSTKTVADKNILKWSTSSIGLQVFAKAGGTPWKVCPRTERCLIVGIGQAHHRSEEGIERFFAYSVLTDSSGAFEEVRVLGEDQDEERYIESFSTNLRKIFKDYSSHFSSFVVHATFSVGWRELESIATALSEQKKEQKEAGEFVSLKFNDRNRFFGFAVDHNNRVPYESTVVPLSHNEFLVWFEGLQYGRPTVHKVVGNPLHVQFTYPKKLGRHQQRAHLQDAINLSGANWRGFNAKSLPVSVYYAQIIAKYLKEFDRHGLSTVDVNVLTPWFL